MDEIKVRQTIQDFEKSCKTDTALTLQRNIHVIKLTKEPSEDASAKANFIKEFLYEKSPKTTG
jgi:hypothetical protein